MILRNRDHYDGVIVAVRRIGRSARLTGVDNPIRVGRPDIHLDVEQTLVHCHGELLARGISGRAVHADAAALLDARRDQRDVAARLRSDDLRAREDLDLRGG